MVDPDRARALEIFKDEFSRTYGAGVHFRINRAGLRQNIFEEIALENTEIDAMVAPHDWLGSLLQQQLIVRAEPIRRDPVELFPRWSLEALSSNGVLYGLPTTMDTVALFTNTELVPKAPDSIYELLDIGARLVKQGKARRSIGLRVDDNGDPFQIWPIITSRGGWLFKTDPSGNWNTRDNGIDTPETIDSLKLLSSIARGGDLFFEDHKEQVVEQFCDGAVPFLLSSSDALLPVEASNIPLRLSSLPAAIPGERAPAFTLVHGLFVCAKSENKISTQDLFSDYLRQEHVLARISVTTGAPVALSHGGLVSHNITFFQGECALNPALPIHRSMSDTWRRIEQLERDIIGGGDPSEAAQRCAEDLRLLHE